MPVMSIAPWSCFGSHTAEVAVGDELVPVRGGPVQLVLAAEEEDADHRLDQAIAIDGRTFPADAPVTVSRTLNIGSQRVAAMAIAGEEVGLCWPSGTPMEGVFRVTAPTLPAHDAYPCPMVSAPEHEGVLCFATGTRIATPGGPRRVETLRPGELVTTADGSPQPVLWSGRREVLFDRGEDPRRPILFHKDSLAPGLPERDLMVSPGHRIVVRGGAAEGLSDFDETLAPAEALADLRGSRPMSGKRRVTYVHVMLARHSVIFAEGVATESFYPDRAAICTLTDAQRAAVFDVCPALRHAPDTGYGPRARPALTTDQALQLVRRHKEAGTAPCATPVEATLRDAS